MLILTFEVIVQLLIQYTFINCKKNPFFLAQHCVEPEERFEYSIDIDDYNDYQYNEEDFDFEPKPKKRKYTKKRNKKNKHYHQQQDETEGPMLADISSQNDQEDSVKKMLACNHCPKEFPTPSKLKRHVSQIHEGIKNYQCDRCK